MTAPQTLDTPTTPAGPKGRFRRRRAGNSLVARGEPMVWLTAGALCICLLMIVAFLALVVWQGAVTFWPGRLVQVRDVDGELLLGEVAGSESYEPSPAALQAVADPDVRARRTGWLEARGGQAKRWLLRTGNFDLTGTHFHWVSDFEIAEVSHPRWAVLVERQSWGRLYGTPVAFVLDGKVVADTPAEAWALYERHHDAVRARWEQRRELETDVVGAINRRLEDARLALREVELEAGKDSPAWQRQRRAQQAVEDWAQQRYAEVTERIRQLNAANDRYQLRFRTAGGVETTVGLADIVRAFPANQLGFTERVGVYLDRWWEFLSAEPREANSEGGVFPAIFGTLMMTLLMAVAVVPFGVLAALYLREYARPGPIVSVVRIAINNLAGVPSIVFGVFGLGFFCYGLGSWIDAGPENPWPPGLWLTAVGVLVGVILTALGLGLLRPRRAADATRAQRVLGKVLAVLWLLAVVAAVAVIYQTPYFDGLYREKLPNPTFGKGALVWASLTLALLTLPVVIVATEEALAAVPNSMREGSYACGGSKWQTIRRIVLPRAMPGILTGTILAMARGAGEVAPLMLVGAVKLAQELPVAARPPFGLDRSFMHLGFHIFDLGFQSQNSEAAKPMVFTTTLLLIAMIAALNLTAIWLRARLRKRFEGTQL